MELSEGMVAVVRGTQEALCVTLVDGPRQYTLIPNATVHKKVSTSVQSTQKTEMVQHGTECHNTVHCDSAAQAVDGQYASMYKMAHCNVSPTSPAPTLSEFPPQRAELCPGRGNFQIGGLGSGENYSPARVCSSFRGGMCWPDRGSVCSPRPSHEPDAFASSLRKYPCMSPERSTEVMERLVNFTQQKNARNIKNYSPSLDRSSRYCNRLRCEQEAVLEDSPIRDRRTVESPIRDRRTLESPFRDGRIVESPFRDRIIEGQSPIRDMISEESTLRDRRIDESPIRDRSIEEWEYRRFYGTRSYDVRYARDMTRRTRESIKNVSTYPYSHPVCPTIKERFDHLPPQQKYRDLNTTRSVNMETQADVPMVSKEIATVPRIPPSIRNVAAPLSPLSSNYDSKRENTLKSKCSSKSIQTTTTQDVKSNLKKSVQTCFSSVDIKCKKVKNNRKSRSHEELRVSDDFDEETSQLIQELITCPNLHTESEVRNRLIRKLRRAHRLDRRDKVKIKIGKCITDQLYSDIDLKNFTRELSKELIAKIKRHSMFIGNDNYVYRAELKSFKKNNEENCIDEIIEEWLSDLPIKNTDYLGRDVKKGHLLHTIANEIRIIIINKLKYNSDSTMKADITEILEDIPIDVNGHNKRYYLNRLVSDLMRKIKDRFTVGYRRRWRKESPFPFIQPTENELKLFAREEIIEFTKKFHIKVCPQTLKQIELELTNILMDSVEIIRLGNLEDVKEDILMMLADYVSITEHQAIYFANNIIYNLKDTFEQLNSIRNQRSQTFIVLQNSLDNTQQGGNTNNTDSSIKGITEYDLKMNLETYTNQIANQIDEWSANKKGFDKVDTAFKKVVIHDLAGDIVDRHKYLELNSSNKNTEDDELEHLKYQIFKWINKIAGEDNLDTIEHASELMERVKSIPVPMLTNPQQNLKGNLPSCCQNTNFTDSSKPISVQSTSKGRRFSSPDQDESQKQSEHFGTVMMTGKEFMNQNRYQSTSPGLPERSCCKNTAPQDTASIQNETMQSGMQSTSVGVTSTPKKSSPLADPAGPAKGQQTQMRQPQGTSVSVIEPRDKAHSPVRKMSGPAGFPNGPKGGNKSQEIGNQSVPGSASKVNQASCCQTSDGNTVLTKEQETQSVKQLNDEYDEFVRNWVEQIPISGTDRTLVDKTKLGIYNGVWKAITKLKMDPATMGNPFYYQDMFEEELEDLLNCLPQTEELKGKKHALKSQLTEKTGETNELILSASGPSSYKQQLVESVNNNLPKAKLDTRDDVTKLYEEMTKMNIVENFILYINYRDFDRVKANVFKKKLMKEVQELIHGIKASHGKELKDIDTSAYIKEIIAALQKVPLPSEDTIREESDEIYIGLEIEQWFSDLPLVPISTNVESLSRKRYKDALAKKIHDFETQSKFADCENQIREEVRRFLEKMPVTPSETDNIDFMVEELVNRLKNRYRLMNNVDAVGGEKKRAVAFMDSYNYEEFSRDMPVCSSFSDLGRAQANGSSYMIVDGTRVKDKDPTHYARLRDPTPESQQQWYTLEESGAPSKSLQEAKQDNLSPCCKTQSGQTSTPPVETTGKPSTYSSSSQTPGQVTINEPSDSPGQSKLSRSYPESRSRFEQGPRISREDYDPDDEAIGSTRYSKDHGSFDQSRSRLEQGTQASCCKEDPQTSRQDYKAETAGPSNELDKPKTCGACQSRRSSAPPSYRTEGSTRPASVQTPDFERQSPKTTIPSAQFCGEPIGYSTPQNTSQERERPASRPKKRTREVERPRREAARKRLDLDDTENESGEEYRCRCMERVWKCRGRKPMHPPCDDKDYLPCFMGYAPHPFFY